MALYTGVEVIEVTDTELATWYSNKALPLPPKLKNISQNCGIVLKHPSCKEHGLVKGTQIVSYKYPEVFGVKPKNTEQHLAMRMLLDDDIKLKIIAGKEGVGKNYITAACMLHMLMESGQYKKLVLTRTTDEVGKTLGLFPGTSADKFANHTASFTYTFKAVCPDPGYIDMYMERGDIEFVPVQLMRGISFPKGTLVWADEIAGLSPYELRMLGTRLGEDCALVLTGSFEQIDRKVSAENCGLHKLVHNSKVQESELSAYIELIKNERSALSKLIGDAL